jgi:fatty acid desaturase
MSIDRIVIAFAGFVILLSLALGSSASPLFLSGYWLFLTAFVGLNLFQSAFTGFCPLALILKALGKKPGAAF